MIFTSYTYVGFLLVVFLVNWLLPARMRNAFLVVASYVFYAAWKWQFAFLLLGLSVFNWAYARWILAKAESTWPLIVGVGVNLGALVYFKYTNFLIANVAAVANLLGGGWHPSPADIILPLGISFFTFQGIAYLFDVATGEEPLESLLSFLLFKALWPQLIAGPIIRLGEIRAQLEAHRALTYDHVAYGARRILSGFFKKIVLADNIAPAVEMAFLNRGTPGAMDVVAGVLGFSLQIYFDFSAYSDIAIGSARLFGFTFPENFNWPYVSTTPQEFWNRWHMTLSRWIRDYVYTPLSFSTRRKPAMAPLWLLFAMALCGLWHGAQWTFVLWGLWHGILLTVGAVVQRRAGATASAMRSAAGWLLTFVGVCLGWLLFRATSVTQAVGMLRAVFSLRGGVRPTVLRENEVLFIGVVFAIMLLIQLSQRLMPEGVLATTRRSPLMRILKPVAYAVMIIAVVVFDQEAKAFVYFQF